MPFNYSFNFNRQPTAYSLPLTYAFGADAAGYQSLCNRQRGVDRLNISKKIFYSVATAVALPIRKIAENERSVSTKSERVFREQCTSDLLA